MLRCPTHDVRLPACCAGRQSRTLRRRGDARRSPPWSIVPPPPASLLPLPCEAPSDLYYLLPPSSPVESQTRKFVSASASRISASRPSAGVDDCFGRCRPTTLRRKMVSTAQALRAGTSVRPAVCLVQLADLLSRSPIRSLARDSFFYDLLRSQPMPGSRRMTLTGNDSAASSASSTAAAATAAGQPLPLGPALPHRDSLSPHLASPESASTDAPTLVTLSAWCEAWWQRGAHGPLNDLFEVMAGVVKVRPLRRHARGASGQRSDRALVSNPVLDSVPPPCMRDTSRSSSPGQSTFACTYRATTHRQSSS